MTESERQEIKAKLIELGFWGADEPGDPTTDRDAALQLRNRIVRRIAPGFSVRFGFVNRHVTAYNLFDSASDDQFARPNETASDFELA